MRGKGTDLDSRHPPHPALSPHKGGWSGFKARRTLFSSAALSLALALAVPAVAAEAPASSGTGILIPALRGIVFLDSPDEVQPKGLDQPGLDVSRVPLLAGPDFAQTMDAYLGKSVTLASLEALKRSVVEYYRTRNHPLVDVAVPVQNIASGTIQVIAREFKVGKVIAEGNRWFSDDQILDFIPFHPGDTVDGAQLTEALDSLNGNQFRQVSVSYRPSAEPGHTDLVVTTEDRLPLGVSVGYQNNGTKTTGRDRWNLGLDWGDALWLGHQFTYQFTASDDFWHHREIIDGAETKPTDMGHTVTYLIPLGVGEAISINGNYTRQVPRLGPSLGMVGLSGSASIRYQRTLPSLSWFTNQVQIGYDFKTTNNNLSFGGETVSAGTTEIDQFPIDYTMTIPDGWGTTLIDNDFVFSPGNLTAGNRTAAFQPSASHSGTSYATSDYVYDKLSLTRSFPLPWGFSSLTKANYQWSDHNLLPSEQVSIGGSSSVRGYDESTATGTIGGVVTQEFHLPPFSPAHVVTGGDSIDSVDLFAFGDYGSVHQKQVAAGGTTSDQLASVGMGIHYHLGRFVSVSLDYGWQLRKAPSATDHGEFGHLSVTLAY